MGLIERENNMIKDVYYTMLDSNLPKSIQISNINKLALDTTYDNVKFIMPVRKKYWENAARVLQKRGYPYIDDVIPKLFEWMQDMNWPGAIIAEEILKSLPKKILVNHLEESIKSAVVLKDEIWLNWLYVFIYDRVLIKEDFNNTNLYLILNSHSEFFI